MLPGELFLVEENGLRRLTTINDEFLRGIRLADAEKVR
jgi:hypothetical protein